LKGWRDNGPIIVNSSRAILYASGGADFVQAARQEALKTRALLQAVRP
jgi:orotidine-5'-phosphate decarboxylase